MERKIERFDKYMKYKGLNDNKVTNSLGLSIGTLGKSRKENRDLSDRNIENILKFYTDLNRTWLLTGEGEMLANENTNSQSLPKTSYTTGRPYYNVDFIGGFDLVLNDQTIMPEYNIDFAPYNQDGVFWCNITGNSMQPKISHGDIIALKEVSDWQSFLTMGEIYAIVTTNELRTVKIIRRGISDDVFRLIPINTTDFDEQEIPKVMILRVFEVLGCMKRI
ncbi:hypothetical protein HMPREF0666_01107 [Prevotella sp. C561]|jgi:hypothetical protein|uniref:S24 family peptidase n=1 Tax=Prevotella sp. C561 TaxID=563031 RepID=UPI0002238D36|nr:S24 family peptidase [Prevotella sp. C561]EGW47742.1 hypothetical protein HMPREF0666_01107 [Prevotella sp. C561]